VIGERSRLRLEQPHFKAHDRDGSSWALDSVGLSDFVVAWTNGKPFWNGLSVWGDETAIKLAAVIGVTVYTEETLALRVEEEEKRRAITS
jgi:hypothetical protein